MVGTTLNKETYAITSASTGPLDIPFRYDDNSWIYAVAFSGDGETQSTLVLGSDFTLAGDGTQSLGEITLSESFLETVSTATLVVYRIAPALQTLDLQYNTRLPAEALEAALDTLAMASIDRSNISQRTFTLPFSDPESFASSYQIEGANDRKGTVMAFSTVDGKPVRLTYAEIAPLILQYYGLEITSEDVLAAISAIAPMEIFDVPDINTPGKFGQLAIIGELVDLVVSGTLSPAIGGTVLPWKVENEKRWFSTSGQDPTTDGLESSVVIGWTGNAWSILYYFEGVAQSTAWVSLPGAWNDDPYPNNVPTWVPLGGATGQPDITVTNERTARAWANLAPDGMVPNWFEITTTESDRSKTHVVIIGNSISVGQGTPEQSWPGQLEGLSFFAGCTFHNLAVNGRTITTMDSTYAAEVAQYHPNGDDILETYVFLISPASNDYSDNSAIQLTAGEINDHFDSIMEKARAGGCKTVAGSTLRRTDVGVLPADEVIRQAANLHAKQSDLADFFVDMDNFLPDPDDTSWYAGGGIHPNVIADRAFAFIVNGVMESGGSYMKPQGPKLSGGNHWREQQTIDLGTNGPDDHALKVNITSDLFTRAVVFTNDDLIKHCIGIAGSGDGYAVQWIDFVSGQTVWKTDSGCLVPGVAIKTSDTYANDAAAAAATPPIPVGGWYARTSDNVVVRRFS